MLLWTLVVEHLVIRNAELNERMCNNPIQFIDKFWFRESFKSANESSSTEEKRCLHATWMTPLLSARIACNISPVVRIAVFGKTIYRMFGICGITGNLWINACSWRQWGHFLWGFVSVTTLNAFRRTSALQVLHLGWLGRHLVEKDGSSIFRLAQNGWGPQRREVPMRISLFPDICHWQCR